MNPQQTLLARLFDRLAARDAEGAALCYHREIFFTNPLFHRVHGDDVRAMWAMVFEALDDFELRVGETGAEPDGGHASWVARYRLGPRGRRVTTVGRSLFAFREGLVCRHYDHFSLWRWSASALGPAGAALGWFGPFRWAVRQSLARRLDRYRD
ncbi:MAG TPA: nuclear transport factor 2 family protein [Usitatibacter sp.]|nr:nuclear transport factor 2 family protein [Usitatibacter sp.]